MKKYKETLNTDKKLMLDLLKLNIKGVEIMAANMLDPHTEYPVLMKLLRKLVKGYK